MTELFLRLNLEALQAMTQGNEIVFDCEGLRIFLSCDDVTVEQFNQAVQRALLHNLPVSNTHH